MILAFVHINRDEDDGADDIDDVDGKDEVDQKKCFSFQMLVQQHSLLLQAVPSSYPAFLRQGP